MLRKRATWISWTTRISIIGWILAGRMDDASLFARHGGISASVPDAFRPWTAADEHGSGELAEGAGMVRSEPSRQQQRQRQYVRIVRPRPLVHHEMICAELVGAGAYSHNLLMAIRTIWMLPAAFVAWTAPAAADVGALPNSQTEDPAEAEIGVSLITAFGAGGRFEDNAINRYGLGFGVRAGVTLGAPRLYLGGSFIRFIGGQDQSGEFYTSTLDAEVGYEFRLLDEILVVRPQLGLGVAQTVTIQSDNEGYPLALHGAPGILLGVRLAPVFISAEVRRDLVPGEWSNAATFMFAAGAAF